MTDELRAPFLVLLLTLFLMWSSVWIGVFIRKRHQELDKDVSRDFEILLGSTLTLLSLIIGFSLSMAINRYDQRKNYEEAEANAIGTEYLRADLLPAVDSARVRTLLREYLQLRISFYQTRNKLDLQKINNRTAQLQDELWSVVQIPVAAQPNPVHGLVLSGMNDVLNSQGYTQAAWWNRTPIGVWGLMATVGIFSCLMIGYISHRATEGFVRLLILPLILSIAFFLIADVDSPRSGVIRVVPQNLVSLSQSLPGR
jgi:ABC-type uncharacterized transport system fused permease/ATPase subunit